MMRRRSSSPGGTFTSSASNVPLGEGERGGGGSGELGSKRRLLGGAEPREFTEGGGGGCAPAST